MISEARLQEIAAHLEGRWWERATNLELCELQSDDPLPEIAKSWIAGEVRWDPDNSGGQIHEDAAARVRCRIHLRGLLDLPRKDCIARRPEWLGQRWCACLTLTLDDLLDEREEDLERETVLKAARRIHKRPPRKRKPKPKPQPDPPALEEEPVVLVSDPLPTPPDPRLVNQTPTRPLLPRYRALTGREWRSKGNGDNNIMDRIF